MAKIVVIEDDYDISMLIRDVLRESDYDVISYVRPNADILQHLHAYRPDLILLDARLNCSVSGWDIIEALKEDESTASIPIILVSGALAEIQQHHDLLHRYHVPVLEKPFDISDLHALVERELVGQV